MSYDLPEGNPQSRPSPWPVLGRWALPAAAALALLAGLHLLQERNYLLFHSLVELFSVAVAGGLFMLAWHSRRYMRNDYLLWIGVAFLFCGALDLVHALVYRGMDVVPGLGSNEATQLWIAARGMQALSLVLAPLFLRQRANLALLLLGYAAATTLALLAVFLWKNFPVCYDDALGRLTPFKIHAEYAISGLLALSILLLIRQGAYLDRGVMGLMIASIAVTIVGELAFTLYKDPFGPANLLGHYLKIIAYFLVYRALIVTGFERPYDLLFRDLRRAEQELRTLNESLEEKVAARTAQLQALSLALAQAEQQERRRLAEVLHDHLQQLLAAARMHLGLVRRGELSERQGQAARQTDELLGEAMQVSRSLSVELSPPALREGGLSEALGWLGEQMRERHGLAVQVDAEPGAEPQADELQALLLQGVRELLFNVVKHADTDRATVRMRRVGEEVEIVVADEGRGFAAAAAPRGEGSFGLGTLRGRLRILGGNLEMHSAPGEGTRVTIRVPLRAGVGTEGS